jgi:hypothetical protein
MRERYRKRIDASETDKPQSQGIKHHKHMDAWESWCERQDGKGKRGGDGT